MNDLAAPDLEHRLLAEDHTSLRLWLRLLTTTIRLEDTVRQRLREGFGITLPRFDLMAQLEREPDGLTMGELSRRMMVTGGNITTIVDQLEKENMVQRVVSPSDRRSYSVRMTAQGRAAFETMAKAHEQWVIGLMSTLSEDQQLQLHTLLGLLKQGLLQDPPPPRGLT
ncbi:MAG: MarR family transcriptional regulator [Betaproteobacteria bacterium]|jgi:DNA-binding MarR family transcriptional regulator|nr:MarR family transcriptional regulator [Betaproteobacteria bacterium]NBP43755.1 MarR family transcriptional regulator [Betaproteobacteria bacterium]